MLKTVVLLNIFVTFFSGFFDEKKIDPLGASLPDKSSGWFLNQVYFMGTFREKKKIHFFEFSLSNYCQNEAGVCKERCNISGYFLSRLFFCGFQINSQFRKRMTK